MDTGEEKVEIEEEPLLDQANLATTDVAAESKIEDSTAEKKKTFSPKREVKKKRERKENAEKMLKKAVML